MKIMVILVSVIFVLGFGFLGAMIMYLTDDEPFNIVYPTEEKKDEKETESNSRND